MELEDVKKKITPVLKEFGVEYAGVFGSVARGEANQESDVDILVRLGRPTGMFKYMRLISSLEQSLSKKVDLVTESSLNKFVKPYAMADLKTVYIEDKSSI